MKIISLNTWGGRAGRAEQLEFFRNHRDVDIFCLQEIWSAAYEDHEGCYVGGRPLDHSEIMVQGLQDICATLSDHIPFFRPHHLDNYGILMLVHKKIKVLEEGEVYVYKHKGFVPTGDIGNHARNLQYASLDSGGKKFTVANIHGLWNGKGKGDSEDRLVQSDNIVNFFKGVNGPYVLCGDFNLRPDTQSLKKLKDFGMRDLISEYGITSTRTSLYSKPERFADYTFVGHGIQVLDFQILPDEVSDHSPMQLIFDVE